MDLGKMTLALDFSQRHITRTIPAFHKELLNAWSKHKEHRIRIQTPKFTVDILQEPLFLNELIVARNKPLLYCIRIGLQLVFCVLRIYATRSSLVFYLYQRS